MSHQSSSSTSLTRLADLLRHPLKLRLVICPVILGGWYLLYFSPLSDDMVATQARIEKERKRIVVARQVEEARKSLSVYRGRVPANSDTNELMQFVMSRIRKSPLKLLDLNPETSKNLGPYDAIALRLTLEGTYTQLHELLNWIQNEPRLLRVETLSLTSARNTAKKKHENEPVKLAIRLSLAGLMEKTGSEKTLAKSR
jgi:Tfp pilus assembly protein PilO